MSVKVREKVKGSGEYWIFIHHQGRRKAKKVGKDRRFALEVARKIEAKIVLGDTGLIEDRPEIPIFGKYADMWITVIIPTTCKSSTISDYGHVLKKHILPVFGGKLITEINRLMVKEFISEKCKQGFAKSTVGRIKNCLSGIFNLAIDDEVISVNPAYNLGKIISKKKSELSRTIDFLTREELSHLLKMFDKYFPEYYSFILILARTGMRLGEAIGLQWGDIDFSGRFFNIQRTLTRGKIGTPKNGKSRRVDMSMQLTETLWRLKHDRERKLGKDMPDWVFINGAGNPFKEGYLRNFVFKKVLEKAELRSIKIHILRHTYASLLLQAGESMAYIQEQLGHHSIKVTVDVYGHLIPGGNKEAVDKLDDTPEIVTKRNLYATRTMIDLPAIE